MLMNFVSGRILFLVQFNRIPIRGVESRSLSNSNEKSLATFVRGVVQLGSRRQID